MRTLSLLTALVSTLVLAACSSGDADSSDSAATGDSFLADVPDTGRDLVSVIEDREGFSVFSRGIAEAGLIGSLRGSGPFTVLAPSDSAFNALPPSQLAALMADSTALADLIQQHVIPGILTAADIQGMTSVTTLQGRTLPVRVEGGVARVRDVAIVEGDIEADNGIIHIIDGVLASGN
ncbi:MAG TPA: fasciclin domain-containing protein [Gemmatimonadales bacterium]|nr:fasciclin domain-containing protein [Gemmatimonadales bacterium]